jgi:hypothetical protein
MRLPCINYGVAISYYRIPRLGNNIILIGKGYIRKVEYWHKKTLEILYINIIHYNDHALRYFILYDTFLNITTIILIRKLVPRGLYS